MVWTEEVHRGIAEANNGGNNVMLIRFNLSVIINVLGVELEK